MSLFKYLALVTEIRSQINQRHALVDVLFLVLAGVSLWANGWAEAIVWRASS